MSMAVNWIELAQKMAEAASERFAADRKRLLPKKSASGCPSGLPPHNSDRQSVRSLKRIGHYDTKIFLSRVEVFGPDPFTVGAFRCGDDHAIIEMQAVGSPCFDGAAYDLVIGQDESNRS